MDVMKNDAYHIERMIRYIEIIERYYDRVLFSGKGMRADDQDCDGVIYKFTQLREEAKHISEAVLVMDKELRDHISFLVSFRNRIVHDYENVDYGYFNEIIEVDLPILKELLQKALARLQTENN